MLFQCSAMEAAADANYRLGMLCQQQGNQEEALGYYKEFLALCTTAGDKVRPRGCHSRAPLFATLSYLPLFKILTEAPCCLL